MMCQRLSADALVALAMNVDIPNLSFPIETEASCIGVCRPDADPSEPGHCRTGPGNGKPKSYARFWALSSWRRLAPATLMHGRGLADNRHGEGTGCDFVIA